MAEHWDNTYDGFDQVMGSTKWVMDAARKRLPPSEVGPSCAEDHSWVLVGDVLAKGATVYGCGECSKRGLVVLRTVAA